MLTDELNDLATPVLGTDSRGSNLAARVSWLDVLPMIGEAWVLALRHTLLPQDFPCPFCETVGRATIYADTRQGGEWLHCRCCGFAGDVFEFAGRKLRMTAVEAARHLVLRGLRIDNDSPFEQSLQSYADYLAFRDRISGIWRQAVVTAREDRCGGVNRLLGALWLAEEAGRPDWSEKWGQFIGVINRRDILRAFYPFRPSDREWDVRPRFGAGWQSHVLVLPMYDLPGRISGFTFVGVQNGKPAYVVREVYTQAGRPFDHDPGVWMFDNLDAPPSRPFRDELFITNNLLDAFWLQRHHLRLYSQPLPLLVVPPGPSRPRTVWHYKHPCDPIFLTRKPDAAFFDQARELSARVAVLPMNWESFRKRCTESPISTYLTQVAMKAAHWCRSLADTMQTWSTAEVDTFFAQFPESSRNEFFSRLDNGERTAIEKRLPVGVAVRTYRDRGDLITETDQGWQVHPRKKAPYRLLAGRLQIDEIIRRGRRRYFSGRVLLPDGSERLFCVRDQVKRSRMTRALVDQCERRGHFTLTIDAKWRSRIWEIALAFSTPAVADHRDRVGWDRRRSLLAFPAFALTSRGVVAPDYGGLIATAHMPCGNWQPPGRHVPLPGDVLDQAGDAAAVLWAVLAVAVGNLLAPICGQPRQPLFLYGPGALAALEILIKLLDLPVCRLRPDQTDARRQVSRYARHDWLPAVVHRQQFHVLDLSRLLEPTPLPCVLATKPEHALAAYLRAGHRLEVTSPLTWRTDLSATIQNVVLQYLQSALDRLLPFDCIAGNFTETLFADLTTWWREQGGQDQSLKMAARRLVVAGSEPAWQTLAKLTPILGGKTVICLPPTCDRPESVWVAPWEMNRLLTRRKAPLLDEAEIGRRLTGSNAWLGEYTHDNVPGWLFRMDEWENLARGT